jgi:hypothetical protein
MSPNMNFLADMNVRDFLLLHAQCRGKSMKNRGMTDIIDGSPEEKTISSQLSQVNQIMLKLGEKIRNEQVIKEKDLNQIFPKSSNLPAGGNLISKNLTIY